jgi:hypothetical protein
MQRTGRIVAFVFALIVGACAPALEPSGSPSSGPSAGPSTAPSVESSSEPSLEPSGSPGPTPTPAESLGPASWTELTVRGDRPAARENHTWTVATGTRFAYLFGGRDGNAVYEDLWVFDRETDRWQVVAPHGDWPRARFGHEAVWIPDLGLVVWAGQLDGSTFYDDLWLYDPARDAWRPLPSGPDRPTARYGSCSAVIDGQLWISHGFTSEGARFADTWVYEFDAGSWSEVTPPGGPPVERCLHGCWQADSEGLVLYAGQTTGVAALGDLWVLDGARSSSLAWSQVEGQLPPERRLYAHTAWLGREIVVGGAGLGGDYLDDAYVVDRDTLAFGALAIDGPSPSGRAGAELIADPSGDRLLLFGGLDEDGARDDLWELSFR